MSNSGTSSEHLSFYFKTPYINLVLKKHSQPTVTWKGGHRPYMYWGNRDNAQASRQPEQPNGSYQTALAFLLMPHYCQNTTAAASTAEKDKDSSENSRRSSMDDSNVREGQESSHSPTAAPEPVPSAAQTPDLCRESFIGKKSGHNNSKSTLTEIDDDDDDSPGMNAAVARILGGATSTNSSGAASSHRFAEDAAKASAIRRAVLVTDSASPPEDFNSASFQAPKTSTKETSITTPKKKKRSPQTQQHASQSAAAPAGVDPQQSRATQLSSIMQQQQQQLQQKNLELQQQQQMGIQLLKLQQQQSVSARMIAVARAMEVQAAMNQSRVPAPYAPHLVGLLPGAGGPMPGAGGPLLAANPAAMAAVAAATAHSRGSLSQIETGGSGNNDTNNDKNKTLAESDESDRASSSKKRPIEVNDETDDGKRNASAARKRPKAAKSMGKLDILNISRGSFPVKGKIHPRPMDILLGRGRFSSKHPGNVRMHCIIRECLDMHSGFSKSEKTRLAESVHATILKFGRFLKQDAETENWEEATFLEARAKISHLFRDLNRQKKGGSLQSVEVYQRCVRRVLEDLDGDAGFKGKRIAPVDGDTDVGESMETEETQQIKRDLVNRIRSPKAAAQNAEIIPTSLDRVRHLLHSTKNRRTVENDGVAAQGSKDASSSSSLSTVAAAPSMGAHKRVRLPISSNVAEAAHVRVRRPANRNSPLNDTVKLARMSAATPNSHRKSKHTDYSKTKAHAESERASSATETEESDSQSDQNDGASVGSKEDTNAAAPRNVPLSDIDMLQKCLKAELERQVHDTQRPQFPRQNAAPVPPVDVENAMLAPMFASHPSRAQLYRSLLNPSATESAALPAAASHQPPLERLPPNSFTMRPTDDNDNIRHYHNVRVEHLPSQEGQPPITLVYSYHTQVTAYPCLPRDFNIDNYPNVAHQPTISRNPTLTEQLPAFRR